MRLFFLISLFALGVMAACSGSGTSSPQPTDTPASNEVDRPAFRLEFNNRTNLAHWDEVEGAEAYEVEGEVIWWPDCADWDAGFEEPQSLTIAETLPAGTASFTLPQPDDARYTRLKKFMLTVDAVDASGKTIAYNNTGQMNELVCQTIFP